MPKAVDRLELVAHAEQVVSGAPQRVDQGELDAVRVLELVDHEMGNRSRQAAPAAPAWRRRSKRPELEILEVGGRALCLQATVVAV